MQISIIDIARALIDAIEKHTNDESEYLSVDIRDIKTELDELRLWVNTGTLEKRITN